MVPIVAAMQKFRVGWRPNALHLIAERHFGAELVEFSRHRGAIASVGPRWPPPTVRASISRMNPAGSAMNFPLTFSTAVGIDRNGFEE
jgi:hypothetical protein